MNPMRRISPVVTMGILCWPAVGVMLAGALSPGSPEDGKEESGQAVKERSRKGGKEPRYLLFWRTPEQAPELVKTIGEKGDGRTRLLGFGLPTSTFEEEKRVPERIRSAFAAARQHNLALMLHFDFHVAWQNRPDLWNWFDSQKPGYNPANRNNVEWFGWEGPPAKVRYLNWGVPERIAPPMCYTSKAIRAEWTRLIHQVIAPPLRKELAALKREGKEHLFAGVLVGSEPTFDNYTNPDPQTAKMMSEDGSPKGQLGYRSLLDRGYSKARPPANLHQALGQVIQETVAFWCKTFVEAGIPASKLYPHVAAPAPVEVTGAPIQSAFNRWSRPGWTTYPVELLGDGFQPLYAELQKRGNPPWAGVEANAGFPGSAVDWETYLGWHYNHGAVLVAVNTGATGTELPNLLERSAFGPEALAAYRQFLRGERLRETPISADRPQARLRRKMQAVQAGFQAWQAAGRDPSPIAQMVQERLPPLIQSGKFTEAEAILDEALKRLGGKEGDKGTGGDSPPLSPRTQRDEGRAAEGPFTRARRAGPPHLHRADPLVRVGRRRDGVILRTSPQYSRDAWTFAGRAGCRTRRGRRAYRFHRVRWLPAP